MSKPILFTIAIYSRDNKVIKPLSNAFTHEKAEYMCDYYVSKLSLSKGLWIGYDCL